MGPSAPRNRFDRLSALGRLLRPLEVVQVRHLGWSVVSLAARTPVLLLHTTGRRSGTPRTTPVAFQREPAGSLVLVGGASGQRRPPDWVANLRADPRVAVTVDRRRWAMWAEVLEEPERSHLWPRLVRVWPRIETYQRRAGRPVPVIRLVPRFPGVGTDRPPGPAA